MGETTPTGHIQQQWGDQCGARRILAFVPLDDDILAEAQPPSDDCFDRQAKMQETEPRSGNHVPIKRANAMR